MVAVKGFFNGRDSMQNHASGIQQSLSWFAFERSLNVTVAPLLTGTKYPENNIPD